MDTVSFRTLALAALFLSAAESQVFLADPDGTSRSIDAPDTVSSGCKTTFGTSVKCDATLSSIAFDGFEPTSDVLTSVCKDDCLTSLKSLQSSQKDACQTDVTTLNGIRYPATYMTDSLLFAYSYICLKDNSNQFCAPQVDQWAAANGSASDGCKDCVLRTFQAELNSPLGYDADLSSYYSSLTSSCGVTSYPVTSPAPYTLPANSTATSSGSPTPSSAACASHYTVKAGDDCDSVSTALSVSTSMLQYQNSIAADCSNFPKPGTDLCVPATCKLYTLQANDTCFGISQAHNGSFSATQVISWNPRVNRDCSNLEVLVGTHLCISAPGDTSPPDPTTIPTTTATPTTVPTDVVDGTNHYCGKFYKVSPGDTCGSVTVMMSISLKDFYFLNPEVNNPNCTNLLLGYSYCVKPVGDIGAYPGYGGIVNPCINQIPLPASCVETGSVSTVSRWEFPTAAPNITDPDTLPLAAGTKEGCATYVTYLDGARNGSSVNACYSVASVFGTNITDFVSWNPSLKYDENNPQNCVLTKGFRYCAQVTVASPTSTPATTTTTSPSVTTPTPTQDGMVKNCNKFYKVKSGDGCYNIADSNGVALSDLYSWNPALKGDCSGLFPDYYLCVGVTSSSSGTPTTTPTTTTTPPGTTPSPVQDGMVKNCDKFYKVKSGDGCYDIASSNGIALDDLYSWNPALKSDCSGLFPDYYICVGHQSATPTTTPPPSNGTPTPTQDGMVSGCNSFYKVKSGDGCYDIAHDHSIAISDLYSWNPALKGDCSGLFPDYYLCVGRAGTPTTSTPPANATPTPVQDGMVKNCKKFYQVKSGDGCYNLAQSNNIALNDFYSWNPAVKSDCSGLFPNYYVCVGI
ncbi:Peptidoglycan-binding Lysin subgroup [Cordyceps militaris]|uniref:Peptidoglycan-binding Lysin subgroup n=1 Tax=Cordyceps militaris TaxID=73501 RepID=A0A2H4SR99_CORMI|nr:Peptidoglycan-binding Lysin subgroup [Cordyceps militaris]